MAFDPIMMSQLGKVPKKLCDEILEIMAASELPMNVIEIFTQSHVAVTSRDVSLELVKMKNSQGLVEIVDVRERPGFRAVAHYALTDAGRAALSEKMNLAETV